MIDKAISEHDKQEASILLLRDFWIDDTELRDFFIDQGFIKIEMLSSNDINIKDHNSFEDFLEKQSKKKRQFYRREILDLSNQYEIEFTECKDEDIEMCYMMYKNVKENNLTLNTFDLPIKLFYEFSNNPNWELLKVKQLSTNKIAAIGYCYKQENTYYPLIFGINNELENSTDTYKQSLYQVLKRGFDLNCNKVSMGVTAEVTKRKLGATQEERVAYAQIKDNYSMALIESMKMSN